MNLVSSKHLTKFVNELSHECLVELLSALWVSIEKTIVNSLRDNIIEFLEKLLLKLVMEPWLFNKSK